MSESLARQNPQSPFRRAPSMVRQQSRTGRTESVSSGAFEQQTDDLLQLARTNIQKLKVKEEKKASQQCVCVWVGGWVVCVWVGGCVCVCVCVGGWVGGWVGVCGCGWVGGKRVGVCVQLEFINY